MNPITADQKPMGNPGDSDYTDNTSAPTIHDDAEETIGEEEDTAVPISKVIGEEGEGDNIIASSNLVDEEEDEEEEF